MTTPPSARAPMAELRRYRVLVEDATTSRPHQFEPATIHARSLASALRQAAMLPTRHWIGHTPQETP